MPLETLRMAALAALVPVLLVYADTPFRTFGQRFKTQRSAERLVLFSIELNLLLLWALTKLLLERDAPLAPAAVAPVLAWVGVALAWVAAAFTVWARFALGRGFSGTFALRPDHVLVTHGPYAVVRHPMYTGLVALGVGIAIAHDSAVTLGFALLLLVPFWMHTAIEEQMFAPAFGDAWREYARRVPRLVPGWRPRG